ncbi:16S rRNA (cytosine(1402)-N(4))-methyltransferase [Candidatus Woesebacteria bacterium GWB1_43_5]|uniref:Ribosomal RNA small subunit methyltransferase H n=1 Tax=Candidatus Woesebacteria bacterium GWB1_43_5 TaxID=1802474 RepID=A0A1F7WU10_9BACT|nr:MAG: 16S rRNA (cytosine(1402)-N(4))-methyltransferase [Candidatus Woesebacteria bacterium GWB1_43_5]
MLSEVLLYLGLDAPLHTQAKVTTAQSIDMSSSFSVKTVIDATVGAGGYSREICGTGAKVLGIEIDPAMAEIAKLSLKESCPSFKLIVGNFANIESIAKIEGFEAVWGIVFDLGVASPQLISLTRGFSFKNPDALLDMRLDPENQGVSASDLLNALDKSSLMKLFSQTCQFHESKRLAVRIIEERILKPFETVGDFIEATKGIFKKRGIVNPATRPFLALRIAVNSELENLQVALTDSAKLLKPGGRIVVVSFHSGEDQIVKKTFLQFVKLGLGRVLTKKPIVASRAEIEINPRARSAKLRAFEKN